MNFNSINSKSPSEEELGCLAAHPEEDYEGMYESINYRRYRVNNLNYS